MTKNRKGFTLVEIMVVVTLIGFLAMLSVPVFKRIKLRAASASFTSDTRMFSEAFQRYAQEMGSFPDSGAVGVVPGGMEDFIDQNDWGKTTSLGGNYSWLIFPTSDAQRGNYDIGIIQVVAPTLSLEELEDIDSWIDDGNVNSGNVLVAGAGSLVYFIVEI
ncbi:type II secretion system GspH family protein [Opitutaceae bacterium]|nr:type II secretion system GspH family protein [Opitutaceae bacterium]